MAIIHGRNDPHLWFSMPQCWNALLQVNWSIELSRGAASWPILTTTIVNFMTNIMYWLHKLTYILTTTLFILKFWHHSFFITEGSVNIIKPHEHCQILTTHLSEANMLIVFLLKDVCVCLPHYIKVQFGYLLAYRSFSVRINLVFFNH